MSNPLIRKLIDQIHEKHPHVSKDDVRDIWLAGYSRGIKGKVRNTPRINFGITSEQAEILNGAYQRKT